MDDVYIGTIMLWPMSWAPKDWKLCNGEELKINDYTALFSLIGTTYGGDGKTTFALPNLTGYISVGAGNGYSVGDKFGAYKVPLPLNKNTMPEHSHTMSGTCTIPAYSFPMTLEVSSKTGERNSPRKNDCLAATTKMGRSSVNLYTGTLGTEVSLSGVEGTIDASQLNLSGKTEATGGSQSIEIDNVQRSCVVNYIIAIDGEYPPKHNF